jgi:hypothetical protein
MRFFEQKKRLNHIDLSVFKGLEPSNAEWTGHELCPNFAKNNVFVLVLTKCSPIFCN